ncbi:MAG: branched-chain amino acid ABC transporter permease, partial [Desulfobacterales bacterium]
MRCGDFKESYIKDEEIFQSLLVKFWLALFLLFLLILPILANPYVLYVANLIGFAIIGAVGLNILTGFTGQISLGHAAFVGVGGYTAAILMTKLNFSFWLALPCAGFAAALAGLIIGIPSLRVKGLYLCMATLAAQFIFGFIFIHWESMTQGIRGINVASPVIGGFALDTENRFYYLTLVVVILAVGFARNLARSRVGRAFIAIRDRDLAAEIMGISLFRYKLTAFAISSFYAGVAGALWVSFMRIVTPDHFPFHLSIQYLAMVIVGGMG